jgi:hypothetical protein
MLPFKVHSVVLCDDIRIEQNNKFILIGVYTGSVVVPGLPAELLVSWWIQILPEKTGTFELELQLISPEKAILLKAMLGFEIRELDWSAIPLPKAPVHVQSAGELQLQMKLRTESEWTLIQTFAVKVSELAQSAMPLGQTVRY